MDEFIVVYDIREEGLGIAPWIVCFLFALPIVAAILSIVEGRQQGHQGKVLIGGTALILMLCFCGLVVGNVIYQRWQCHQWAKRGEFQVVEGPVKDFKPQNWGGGASENFNVGREHFSYSRYDLNTGAFNRTASQGGPIREGLYVRLSHHKGRILRIEVRQ